MFHSHNDLHIEAPRYLLNFFFFFTYQFLIVMKVSYLILVIIATNIYLPNDLNWYFYAIAISKWQMLLFYHSWVLFNL